MNFIRTHAYKLANSVSPRIFKYGSNSASRFLLRRQSFSVTSSVTTLKQEPIVTSKTGVSSISLDSLDEPERVGLLEKKIRVQNTDINYAVWGHGPHVVFCIPGLFGTIQTDFEPVIVKLNQDKFTVVCCDPPGWGKSRKSGDMSFPRLLPNTLQTDHAETAGIFMDKLGFSKYSVLGWSNGGVTGMILCGMNPDKIRRFISFGAPAYTDRHSRQMGGFMSDLSNWRPDILKQFLEIYGEMMFQGMVNDLRDYILDAKFNVKPLLHKVKAPTLIIHGNKDVNCSVEHARVYKDGIVNSRLEIWPGACHYLHMDPKFQDKFVKRVEKFLLDDDENVNCG